MKSDSHMLDIYPLGHLLKAVLRYPSPALPLLFALVVINLLVNGWKKDLGAQEAENFLASEPQAGVTESVPRYDKSVSRNLPRFVKHIPDSTTTNLIILAGMSQMYSINEPKSGDKTISEWMDDALAPSGRRVFGLAAPNLCNEEALFLFETLLGNRSTTPDAFIYGVCFDKFRNLDLRPSYQRMLFQSDALLQQWRQTASNAAMLTPLASKKMLRTVTVTLPSQENNPSMEDRLRKRVSNVSPLVEMRKELNATLQMKLFLFRNWILNIKPTTKRGIIKSRFDLNAEFLQLLINRSKDSNVQLALYVIPLNPQADNPYISTEYAAFKIWLETLCKQEKIPYANLENVVPSEFWGEFMGGPDFKHFKGEGHRRTAAALVDTFSSLRSPVTTRP